MNWQDLTDFDKFSDITVYFIMGATATILFLLRLGLMMVGIGDADVDVDVDLSHDGGVGEGTGFSMFSMFAVLSFFMGAGWMGLTCRTEWGLGSTASAMAAGGFGLAMNLLASFGLYQMRKLNASGHYDVKSCVGRNGKAYMTIPAKGQGAGQVEVSVSGRRKILKAFSEAGEIEAFTEVTVMQANDDESIVVRPRE